jgi:hypothetical protein
MRHRRGGAAQESLLLSQVAAVLFRPMAEAKGNEQIYL